MALVVSCVLLLLTSTAILQATIISVDPLPVGNVIRVDSYNQKDNNFTIEIPKLSAQGDGTVTPENLAKAIGVEIDKILIDPKSIVGKQFECQSSLPIIQWDLP